MDFIEAERNSLLKQYVSTVHPLDEVPVVVNLNLGSVDGTKNERQVSIESLPENIYKPMLEGPWAGEDARDVLADAISWWERELVAIENAYAAK